MNRAELKVIPMFFVQGEDGCDEVTKFFCYDGVCRILVEDLPNGYF